MRSVLCLANCPLVLGSQMESSPGSWPGTSPWHQLPGVLLTPYDDEQKFTLEPGA